MNTKKVHLVCSAGGVRCFSYIGAIRSIYQHNISVASISACSMGTILGALIASGIDLNELEERVLNFNFSVLRTQKILGKWRLFFRPFATHNFPNYGKIMQELIGEDLTLSKLKIPFAALALDIRQKRFLVYSSESHPDMKISEVIKIATSVPFMYPPYKIEKRLLVDAAVATESPVWMAVNRSGNHPIIVLKVDKEVTESIKGGVFGYAANLISVAAESHDYFAASQISRVIDVTINCEKIAYTDFTITKEQIENLILQGERACEMQLKEFGYDFDNILHFNKARNIEEVGTNYQTNTPHKRTDDNYAELTAKRMIKGFSNEIRNRHQVFVSYSHRDVKWLEKLNTHLSAMERFAGIKAWSDKLIIAGDTWNTEINNALSSAKVAIFLVSKDFLASRFIQENEMNYFLEINQSQKVPIVWIAISDSLYDITPLKDIQCANDPGIPLDTLSEAEQNIQLTKICKKVIELMK